MTAEVNTVANNKIFFINRSDLDGRVDVNYYNQRVDITGKIKLSKFAKIKGGKRIPLGSDYSNAETTYLYLRVANMDEGNDFDYSDFKFISEELFIFLSRYEVFENELIISIAGTIGKIKLVTNIPENKRVILTENCAKIVFDTNRINPKYFQIVLQSTLVQRQIELSYIQTTIPKLGIDKILNLYLPSFPTIQEQRTVVEKFETAYNKKQQKEAQAKQLLQSIDAYILETLGITIPQKQNGIENRMFTTNFSEVVGGRIDGYFYKKEFIDFFSSLQHSKYPVLSLKEISKKITSGITPLSGGDAYTSPEEGIPFVRSGNINIDGDLNFDDLLYLKPEIHNTIMKSSKLQYNDIMIAIVGATIGQVGIYFDEREANINQAIALIRLKDNDQFNPTYIKEVIKSSIGQQNLNRLKRPVARANINLEEISTIQIIVPPIETQLKIVKHIDEIRSQAKQLQADAIAVLETAKAEVEKIIIG